jgi:hypothetical protein
MENTLTNLHPDSILAKVVAGQPLRNAAGQELIRLVPCKRWHIEKRIWEPTMAKLMAIDNGNDAIKTAMPMLNTPHLATLRMPTAYVPEKQIRFGAGRVTWQINGSEKFWFGTEALKTKKAVESLPVGFSHERMPDGRFQRFLAACIVETMIAAGYGQRDASGHLLSGYQGEHDLYVAIGLPPEEVDRTGTTPQARQALRHIFNVPFDVSRIGDEETPITTTWKIRIVELVPYGQSFASFAAWYYGLDGSPISTDIERHVTLDIGGGQFHACEVELDRVSSQARPKLRMTASQIGEGTIVIAREVSEAIRRRFSNIRLTDAEAQQVLVTGMVSTGGRPRPVDDIVRDVIASRSDNLTAIMLRFLQDGQSFLQFTGGGSILLGDTLQQVVAQHRLKEDYFFVPQEVASVLNAIGGVVLAQVAAQKIARTNTDVLLAQHRAQQVSLNGQSK